MKTVAFFNNTSGVGKTTLVYHLAFMLRELGANVLVVDLDPQTDLTAAMLDDEAIEPLFTSTPPQTILGAVQPLLDQLGDIGTPHVIKVDEHLWLLPGDPGLSDVEERLSDAWARGLADTHADRHEGLRITTAFHRIIRQAADDRAIDLVLLDLGPALSSLNRAALVAADHVVVPVAADLLSLRGLLSLGPRLRAWRSGWQVRADAETDLPAGAMDPAGYIVLSHPTRRHRTAHAHPRWIDRLPQVYAQAIMGERSPAARTIDDDPHRLATVRTYTSLVPLAHEANKPIFSLTVRDGALGAHGQAVTRAYREFEALAQRIALACDVPLPAR